MPVSTALLPPDLCWPMDGSSLDELSPQLNRDLEQLEPTGQGNPPAGYAMYGTIRTRVTQPCFEQDSRTLELRGPEAAGLRQYEGSNALCIVDLLPRSRTGFLGVVHDWSLEGDIYAGDWKTAICCATRRANADNSEPARVIGIGQGCEI